MSEPKPDDLPVATALPTKPGQAGAKGKPGQPGTKGKAAKPGGKPDQPAKAAIEPRGIVIDPVVLGVGGAVAAIGVGVLAVFLWMVPGAAAREAQSACRGIGGLGALDRRTLADGRVENPMHGSLELCPGGKPCTLPVPAPDFEAIDITGRKIKLSEYRGRTVLLNFWASWCNVCKAEKPALTSMARELGGDDFVVLTLVSDRTWADAVVAIMQSLAPGAPLPPRDEAGNMSLEALSKAYEAALPDGIPFKPLLDPPLSDDENLGPITKAWGIRAVPESVLIDRDGYIRAYFVNKRDWQAPVAHTCLRSVID